MSMFLCPNCDRMCDSDDGCEDIGDMKRITKLVCQPCADEHREREEAEADKASAMEAEAERRESNQVRP